MEKLPGPTAKLLTGPAIEALEPAARPWAVPGETWK